MFAQTDSDRLQQVGEVAEGDTEDARYRSMSSEFNVTFSPRSLEDSGGHSVSACASPCR